ncbi:hypothetical protein FF011L_38810 [Roseimaritima multifibrata]|uniref:Uncharacterized protein n=1 Tax=Roseimaritima multifibrata TaxID=1930274 RepID=A0A517MJY7_9BACT|nr:hypothetical protein [Roseimaritima multifibrata]QDS95097.1 hypothetical protein FF011L_38810 [Roseimaritima multifibrata]
MTKVPGGEPAFGCRFLNMVELQSYEITQSATVFRQPSQLMAVNVKANVVSSQVDETIRRLLDSASDKSKGANLLGLGYISIR